MPASLPSSARGRTSSGVFEGSENPEAAKEFIAFLSTEGNQLRAEKGDALPLDSTVAEETDWAGESEGRAETLEVVKLAEDEMFVPGFWEVTNPLWDSFALVVEGEMTAQEALDEAAPKMQESLDRAWQTWEDDVVGRATQRAPRRGGRTRAGFLFASPWLIGVVLLLIGPIIASVILSLTNWNLISSPRWVGSGELPRP